jgi:peptidase, M48 family
MKKLCCLILSLGLFSSCAFFNQVLKESGNKTLESLGEAGDAILRADEEITSSQEYYLGRAVAANILSKYALERNAAMEKYLNSICQTLVLHSDKPEIYGGYHVAILKTDELNAFATSGGHILISSGLLKCAESEDAIAAILAHEIAHIHLRHGVKAIKSARALDAVAKTGKALTSAVKLDVLLDDFSTAVDEVLNTMVNSGYSQSHEFEADKLALTLMHDAGYNPYAMLEMLTLLKAHTTDESVGFGKTHPAPQKRLDKVSSTLRKKFSDVERNTRFKREY